LEDEVELLQHIFHLFHNDHGEWALLTAAFSGGFMISDLARRAWSWLRGAWTYATCYCDPAVDPRQHARILDDEGRVLPEWGLSRCPRCGRTWLHFRDWPSRVAELTNNHTPWE
jgi:hypothetical protein